MATVFQTLFQRAKRTSACATLLAFLSLLLNPSGTLSFEVPVSYAASYIVTSTSDSGAGTLRQAIIDANANAGADVITCDASLSGTITLSSILPTITESVDIDCSGSASPVTISGSGATGFSFSTSSQIYTLKGIRISGFQIGILATDNDGSITIGGTNSSAEAVYIDSASSIGIDMAKDSAVIQNVVIGSLGAVATGIDIDSASSGSTIGSTSSNGSVTISSCTQNGIVLAGASTTVQATTVAGCTNAGIRVNPTSSNSVIGGTTAAARNILTGNNIGVSVVGGSTVSIRGNYIGVAANGSSAGNSAFGISVNGGTGVTIGGPDSSYRNVIGGSSSEGSSGVMIESGSAATTIQYNYIGTSPDGSSAIGNQTGISIRDSDVTLSNNLISGNTSAGIGVSDFSQNVSGTIIQDNIIGLNAAGTAALENTGGGIEVQDHNGSYAVTGLSIRDNIISGNGAAAINGQSSEQTGATIWGNYIGTSADGLSAIPNAGQAIDWKGSGLDMDASVDSSKRNVIAGNDGSCLDLEANDAVVKGNYCGVGADGTTEIPNSMGIQISNTGSDNIIGGITSAEKNLVCSSESININFGIGGSGNGNTFRGNDVVCSVEVPIVPFGNLVAPLIVRYPGATGNSNYDAPSVDAATGTAVSGSEACADCAVDLYAKNVDSGGIYIASTTASNSGDFSFTGLNLSGYTHVIATYTDADGSTSPASLTFAISSNAAPSIGTVSAVAATDGSQSVTATVSSLDDSDDDALQLKVEYSVNGGSTWQSATVSTPASGTVDNEDTYQISGLDTSSGAISNFTFEWEAGLDANGVDVSNAQLRVTSSDSLADSSAASSADFELDTASPAAPSLSYAESFSTNDLVVTGTGTEATSNIYIDGVDTGTDTDGSGNLSVSITVLGSGSFTKTLTVVDSFGNTSSPALINSARVITSTGGAGAGGSGGSGGASGSNSNNSNTPPSSTDGESMAGENQNVVETPTETPEEESVEEEVVQEEVIPEEVIPEEVIPEEVPEELAEEIIVEETPVVEPVVPVQTPTEIIVETPRDAFVDSEPVAQSSVTSSVATNSETFGEVTEYGVPEILVQLATGGGRGALDRFDPTGDQDGDGVYNYEELLYFCDLSRSDTDGDGLSDVQEIFGGTSCNSYDSDGDGISDSQDAEPLSYQMPEVDSQILARYTEEYLASAENSETAPSIQVADTDGDGLSDWLELSLKTNPKEVDSDKDGLEDGLERSLYGTDPTTSTSKEELEQLRFSNLNSCSAVEQGGVRFVGHGLANTPVFIYRVAEDGEQVLVGEAVSDERGVFQTLAYGFEPGENNVFATSGKTRRDILQITPIAKIQVLENGGILAPSLVENGLSGDRGTAKLALNTDPGKELFVTWQSTVFSNVLIADASQVSLNKALPKGDHTVTWQARDLESGVCSSPEQRIFNVTHAGFVSLGAAEKAPLSSFLGAALMLASLAGLGYAFQKKRS